MIFTLGVLPLLIFTAIVTCRPPLNGPPLQYRQLGLDIPDGLLQGNLGALAGLLGANQSYDYVIIGGGTAGNAMGYRLAKAGFSTAIVEAGEFYEIGDVVLASTPGGDTVFVGTDITDSDPLVDWEFVAENTPGGNGRDIHYARGKCLGGSSALNFMIYQRPTVDSMQQWADMVGDQSYTFDNVLPYYKKSPWLSPPNMDKRAANATPKYNAAAFDNGNDNPLQISFANYASPFSSWMERGVNSIGIPSAEDFNSGSVMGAQYCTSSIRPSDETRSSSEASFIQNATSAGLSNLKIYTGTLAEKIVFDGNKKATGVMVSADGVEYTISATKEVILSAGTFQSPQMLMLSGIGPADQLQQFNISVISELSGVGQNMWDHPTFGPAYRVDVDTLTKLVNDPLYLAEQVVNYGVAQNGPLTNPVSDFLAWEKIPQDLRSNFTQNALAELATFPSDWPEVEMISGDGYVGNFTNLFTTQPKDGYNYATILAVLIAPLSRGNVTLASASASDKPIINPNWMTSSTDAQVAVAAYKRIRQAFASEAMAPAVIGEEYFPGPEVQTDEQILDVIRGSFHTLWHAACTCKMGNSSDSSAVIDNEARVFGVQGLRVVDASSFPILVPGHPQSTIYMLAEKIADSIIKTQANG